MSKSKSGGASRAEQLAAARKQAEAQARAERRKATVLWGVAIVAIIAVFAGLVAFIVRQNQVGDIFGGPQLQPTVATESGGFAVGTNGVVGQDVSADRVQVDIYIDFMCPICNQFEVINEADLEAMREEGLADIVYHPISILDRFSQGTNYSTRSAASAALIAEEAPEHFLAYVAALFENQPAEGTKGLSDTKLREIALSVGVPAETADKIQDHPYSQWVLAATEQSSIAGVSGTPSLFIDGENRSGQNNPRAVTWSVPGAIRAAVEEAAAS